MFTANSTRPSTRSMLPLDHLILPDDHDEERVGEVLAIVRVGFPNLLLIGDDADLEKVFQRIQPYLRTAIAPWVRDITSNVPATAFNTLIVKDVAHLDAGQQAALTTLIGAVPDVQIVAMAGAPVFPLIDTGAFLTELYYRLNVVTLDFTVRKPLSSVRR